MLPACRLLRHSSTGLVQLARSVCTSLAVVCWTVATPCNISFQCAHRSHCELTHTRPTALTADTHYCASLSSESICTLTVAQLNSVH
eukprot:13314-Heterococcus_DN1.PRE.3